MAAAGEPELTGRKRRQFVTQWPNARPWFTGEDLPLCRGTLGLLFRVQRVKLT